MDLKTIRNQKPRGQYPPDFVLAPEIKHQITGNPNLRNTILNRFGIHQSTLYNWIKRDAPETTSFTFLFLVWDYLNELDPEQYPDISSLLTTANTEPTK